LDDDIVDPISNNIDDGNKIDNVKDDNINLPPAYVEVRNHPHDNILGNISDSVRTRSQLNLFTHVAFTSTIEPKNIKEALLDEYLINAMHDELNQFTRNYIWDLVPRPLDQSIIETKWIFRNKMD
jgi:hypothetical protein